MVLNRREDTYGIFMNTNRLQAKRFSWVKFWKIKNVSVHVFCDELSGEVKKFFKIRCDIRNWSIKRKNPIGGKSK